MHKNNNYIAWARQWWHYLVLLCIIWICRICWNSQFWYMGRTRTGYICCVSSYLEAIHVQHCALCICKCNNESCLIPFILWTNILTHQNESVDICKVNLDYQANRNVNAKWWIYWVKSVCAIRYFSETIKTSVGSVVVLNMMLIIIISTTTNNNMYYMLRNWLDYRIVWALIRPIKYTLQNHSPQIQSKRESQLNE